MVPVRKLDQEWTLPSGQSARIRPARVEDCDPLRGLYFATYGDRYGLSEVADPEEARRTLSSENFVWLLAEVEGEVAASVIFAIEPRHRLGKTFGGVVHPRCRGQKIMDFMLRLGMKQLLVEGGPFDLLYAVVRTFISLHFHNDLKEMGFVDVGVFPNVRKVQRYETHGLKVMLSPEALKKRRKSPRLIPQAHTLYEIVRSRLGFEAPRIEPIRLPPPGPDRIELSVRKDAAGLEKVDFLYRTTRRMDYDFFPLSRPNLVLADAQSKIRAFLNFQEKDGHAAVLGITTGGADRVEVLLSVGDACEALGVVYLELLVPAYDPLLQAQAYQAGFLPCAYFPAACLAPDGKRHDYLITSKTFVPLHFRGLRLTEDSKPYLLEFFKLYTSSLWEELMDA
ncbi:MAG: hypothetical protein AB1758_03650 [Candidatus Eremiobacterota bacterium]